ncbi:protein polyglycylase TTLL10-like isoform X3 [Chiloscyllium plagiosum]|uniref:protein polyglycylase TTLL10-like isoform X3 n=1 Tax=Chiloscyllium plagiosum TaxID=36176 RepID=UPI001CB877FC|nr:protein polyglycylase TTLL10-like isoform X3 [Chiloscyllium plagiosum]
MAISLSSQSEPLAMKSKTTKQRENELKAIKDLKTVKTCVPVSRAAACVNFSENVQHVPCKEIVHLANTTKVGYSQTNDSFRAQKNQGSVDSMKMDRDRGAESKKMKKPVKPEGKKRKRKQALDQAVEVVGHQVTMSSASETNTSGPSNTQSEASEIGKRTGSANQKLGDKSINGKQQEENKEQGPFYYIGGTNGVSLFMKLDEFYPETYRMDLKSERYAFHRVFREGQTWISKPAESSQGRGIFLLRTLNDITAFLKKLESVEENPYFRMCSYNSPLSRIVQRYVAEPLLLEGRKFDVRSYFLIACTSPYVTFFRHGYAKLTCNEYNPNSDDLTDHLTNQFIQKKNPLYNEMKEDTIWSMERLNDYINEKYMEAKRLPRDWVFTVFTKRTQQIMTQCFIATKARLGRKLGYFDLLGFDIMIDQNFKVWLLEINSNPSLQMNCEILKSVIPKVINEALDLIFEIFTKCSRGLYIMPLEAQKEFVLLYNGSPKEPFEKRFKARLEYRISERATILKRPQKDDNRPQIKVLTSLEFIPTLDSTLNHTKATQRFKSLLSQRPLPEISLVQHLSSAKARLKSNQQSSNHSNGVTSEEQSQTKHSSEPGLCKERTKATQLIRKKHSASSQLCKSLENTLMTFNASFHSLIITRTPLTSKKATANYLK